MSKNKKKLLNLNIVLINPNSKVRFSQAVLIWLLKVSQQTDVWTHRLGGFRVLPLRSGVLLLDAAGTHGWAWRQDAGHALHVALGALHLSDESVRPR